VPQYIANEVRKSRSARPSLRLLAAAALACVGLALPSAVKPSAATWTDTETVASEFSAATVPAPTLTDPCEFNAGILGLGARVEIFWSLPDGYQLSDVEVQASTSGLGSILAPLTNFSTTASTTSLGNGVLRTDVPTNLLGGLLGLGSELQLALIVKGPGDWHSAPAAVATNAGLLAGLGATCRNLT